MRYPVEKIKEALLSPNEGVRKQALKFFTESYSEDPEIMLMILQSIEKYGIESIGLRELEKLKQTDETIGSVVRLFESGQVDKATERSHRMLNNLIAKADINLIKPYTERIFQCVSVNDQTRAVLRKRLAMAQWDEDRAWAELEAYNRDEMEKEIEYDEVNKVEYYLDALVNTGVRQSSRLMEALKRPYESIEDDFDRWMLPSYAELAGLLKMTEAIPFLVKLLNEDDDFLQESCANSLMRIGTTEIVGMLADQYETGEDYFKTFAAEIIATIQSDESIALARRQLEIEDDSDQIEFLMYALLMQFDPDQLQFVYDRMVADELAPGVFDLYEYLIEISDLTGVRFKGYEELLPRVVAEKEQQKEMMEQFELEMRERTQLFEEMNKKRLNVEVDSGFIPANTIVNETNRVGRNDPCPCGSGKKFKKCCINKSS